MHQRDERVGVSARQLARITGLDEGQVHDYLLEAGATTLPGRMTATYDARDAVSAVACWIAAGDVEPLSAQVVHLVIAGERGVLAAIERPGSLTPTVSRLVAVLEERRLGRLSTGASRSTR